MNLNEMTYQQKRSIVREIGDAYQRSLRRIEITEHSGSKYQHEILKDDYEMKWFLERALRDCSEESVRILTNDYLKKSDKYWYLNYYATSSYYRLKRKAIDEFLHSIDLS